MQALCTICGDWKRGCKPIIKVKCNSKKEANKYLGKPVCLRCINLNNKAKKQGEDIVFFGV